MTRSGRLRLAVGFVGLAFNVAVVVVVVGTFSRLMDLADLDYNVAGHGGYTLVARICLATALVVVSVVYIPQAAIEGGTTKSRSLYVPRLVVTLILALGGVALLAITVLDFVLEFGQPPFQPQFNAALIPLQVLSLVTALVVFLPLLLELIQNRCVSPEPQPA